MHVKTYSISELARDFHLTRSALLHYDKIGLLSPTARGGNNYRVYSEKDRKKLQLIRSYRDAGISLEDIKRLLGDVRRANSQKILENQLGYIHEQIGALRTQQQVIAHLLDVSDHHPNPRLMTKKRWVEILKLAGFDESQMLRWHAEFEKRAPDAHDDFLKSLGIPNQEISMIRERSRKFFKKRSRPGIHPPSSGA